jgi:hypothetical protein
LLRIVILTLLESMSVLNVAGTDKANVEKKGDNVNYHAFSRHNYAEYRYLRFASSVSEILFFSLRLLAFKRTRRRETQLD